MVRIKRTGATGTDRGSIVAGESRPRAPQQTLNGARSARMRRRPERSRTRPQAWIETTNNPARRRGGSRKIRRQRPWQRSQPHRAMVPMIRIISFLVDSVGGAGRGRDGRQGGECRCRRGLASGDHGSGPGAALGITRGRRRCDVGVLRGLWRTTGRLRQKSGSGVCRGRRCHPARVDRDRARRISDPPSQCRRREASRRTTILLAVACKRKRRRSMATPRGARSARSAPWPRARLRGAGLARPVHRERPRADDSRFAAVVMRKQRRSI